MIDSKRQNALYTKAFRFMREHKVQYVPIDIVSLCQSCSVALTPLSQIVHDTELSEDDVFAIWGNKDGSVTSYGGKHRIAYNDRRCPGRIRFTVCEELGHIICGHVQDPSFNMFSQTYDEKVYARYDEEARMVAGFLVCHPKFFYTHERLLTPAVMSTVCEITLACASARYDILRKYRNEIQSNIPYKSLPIPRAAGGMRKYERRWLDSNSSSERLAI